MVERFIPFHNRTEITDRIIKALVFSFFVGMIQLISSPPASATNVTLTYDANVTQHQTGVIASGAVPNSSVHTQGTSVTVSSNSGTLIRRGFTFGGWNTQADGLGTNYTAGSGVFTISGATTLYANWLIPAAARLIGSSGSIITISGSGANYTNFCNTGLSGITTDGTHIYYRSSKVGAGNYICKVTLSGVFVSAQLVSSASGAPALSDIDVNNRDLTFSSGCIWLRNTGESANTALYCISVSDWTMRPVATPNLKGLFAGGFWLYGNLIDFPDGRIGAVSAPGTPNSTNFGGANGTTTITCPTSPQTMYCKVLRLYKPSGTGASVSLTFSEDILLADTLSGWPADDHGIATDGTYLYQSRHERGYKVWALEQGSPSYLVFNGDANGATATTPACGAGTVGSTTGISNTYCPIFKPFVSSDVTTPRLGNATYFGRSHATNQYLMGDYQSNKFYISAGVAPPAGLGSDKGITFTASAAASLKYGSTTSASYSVNRSLGTESSPSITGTISYETVTSTACNVDSSSGLVTMLRATGACQVRVKLASDTFYSDTSSAVVAITPAKADTLTVTASAVNMTYNGNSQTIPYNYTISGLKFSDTVTALSYGYSGTSNAGNATSGTNSITAAGTYTINPSGASIANSDSYTATSYATGILTVNRAARTITGSAAATVKYGSRETVTVTTVPSSNSDGAQSFTAGSSTACSIVSGTGVLTMNRATGTCSIVPTIAQGANYLTATADTVTVTPALANALVVTAGSATTVYSGSPAVITPSYSISGLQLSDTVTVSYKYSGTSNAGESYSLSDTRPIAAGLYSIIPTISMSNSDSYTALSSITNGTLTISRATRVLSPSTYNKVTLKYGDTATVTSNQTTPSSNSDGTFSYAVSSGCTINSSTGLVTANTYLDTCLATTTLSRGNNYESATASGVTFTLSKADTLTVTTDTPIAVTYTGSIASISPAVSAVSGLVSGDVINTATINYSASTATCANGGLCSVGEIGPSGGYVFYVSPTAINVAAGISTGGIYLEAAPVGAQGTAQYGCTGSSSPGTSYSVGSGASNTLAIISSCATAGIAARVTSDLTYAGFSDWFMPSLDEMTLIYNNLYNRTPSLGGFTGVDYGSSSEGTNGFGYQAYWWFGAGAVSGQTNKNYVGYYRPIRAFNPIYTSSISYGPSTTKPTDAGTYTITPSALTFTNGAAANYTAITYRTSTVTINKASQSTLSLTSRVGVFSANPSTMKLITSGGNDTGTVTYAISSGGSALNCTISGDQLTVTSTGTCLVAATKAATNNYLVITSDTVTVTFNLFVAHQPIQTQQVPTQLPINGANSLETTTATIPMITSISLLAGVYQVNGTGFSGVSRVTIGGVDVTYTYVSPTQINIPTGAGVTEGSRIVIECTDGRRGPSPREIFRVFSS
jgi:hypothetical protein